MLNVTYPDKYPDMQTTKYVLVHIQFSGQYTHISKTNTVTSRTYSSQLFCLITFDGQPFASIFR